MNYIAPLDQLSPELCTGQRWRQDALKPYSYRDARYLDLPGDECVNLVAEENTKLFSCMTLAEAELLTAATAEEFEAKFAEIVATRSTLAELDLIAEYNSDRFQAAKQQLKIDFFYPPYKEAAE